ncbi:MAG: TPM domain-containing protein [Flavobacteriales bacterium]|nr:TPM domain-containing protein [Flavobacteriales bacterium]MBP9078715.1 TPM domain-containing protein [Flavobacteriales bacterium]
MKQRVDIEDWLTPDELARVREAVRQAEQRTSGEIRVHLDVAILDDVLDHAAFVFNDLGMANTRERNGVLLYVSVPGRRVAVVGDTGIHAKLGDAYWQGVLEVVLGHFREDRFCEGLCMGVHLLGEKLQEHFPFQRGDRNELSDDISFGA